MYMYMYTNLVSFRYDGNSLHFTQIPMVQLTAHSLVVVLLRNHRHL